MNKTEIKKLKEVRDKLIIYSDIVINDFSDKDYKLKHLIKLLKGIKLEFNDYLKNIEE